jgi:signal transduction histidine kinase
VAERQRLEREILEISDREQARLGQEIHDGLCQQLVSLAFDATSLANKLGSQKPSEAQTAHCLADGLDRAITEARRLARGLFPIRLEAQGLPSALEELTRATCKRFGLHCRFELRGNVAIKSRSVATHLYRIAQEAVHNAIRHAQATHIKVRLESIADCLKLVIEDNGIGLCAHRVKECRGLGLHIMNYRARTIGGTFSFGLRRAGGTEISCSVKTRVD